MVENGMSLFSENSHDFNEPNHTKICHLDLDIRRRT